MKERDTHFLISESAGRCNFPGCNELLFHRYEDETFVKLVDYCHIIGKEKKGPRGDVKKSQLMKNDPKNIILLCPNHHRIVDGNEKEYPNEVLYEMKEEHIKYISNRLDGLKEANWTLLLHNGNTKNQGIQLIDSELIIREFYGDYYFPHIEKLEVTDYLPDRKKWLKYKKKQSKWWRKFIKRVNYPLKFVICSLNFIPLVIHLGYLVGDANPAEIYQYQREINSWKWKTIDQYDTQDHYKITSNDFEEDDSEIMAISFSISAVVRDETIFETIGNKVKIIKIEVDNPNRLWLQYKEQVIEFQTKFVNLLDNIVKKHQQVKEIHLFYAGPTPLAFKIGSAINPNMHPKFVLYKFNIKTSPQYTRVFEIN